MDVHFERSYGLPHDDEGYFVVVRDEEGAVVSTIRVPYRDAHRLNREIVTILNQDDAEQARAEAAYEQWQMGSGR